jgi:hypothetical protein
MPIMHIGHLSAIFVNLSIANRGSFLPLPKSQRVSVKASTPIIKTSDQETIFVI